MYVKALILSAVFFVGNALSMNVTAQSWLVADDTGKILQSQKDDHQRSIASITKLMTVMVVLDANQDLSEKPYGQFTRAQLIQMALVKSDNTAAKQLCDNYPGGFTYCVRAMNAKALELNMEKTKFVDSTGLSPMNVSTATDLVKMVKSAQTYPEVVLASRLPVVKIKVKKKWFFFKNTNPIIGHHHSFLVSKTGWTKAAGGCIVMMLDTEIGRRIVVVLGSKNTHTRIPEAEFIAKSI